MSKGTFMAEMEADIFNTAQNFAAKYGKSFTWVLEEDLPYLAAK